MFDYSQFEKQKMERAKILSVNKFSLKLDQTPVSSDQLEEALQIQHIRAIINEQ